MEKSDLTPEFYTGSPLDSTDLRYRDEFIEELWDTLLTKHVLLVAPRRTGKTSVMDHFVSHPKTGYIVVKENVQDLDHPADFFLSLLSRFNDEHPSILRKLQESGWKLMKDAFSKIENVGISEFKVALRESDPSWQENWRQHGYDLLSRLRKQGQPTLLIIDELPDMLLNLNKSHPELLQPFLAWFRSQRLDPTPKKDSIRWLLGGSINLYSTLDAVEMVDLINDLHNLPLPVLTNEQVEHFVTTMLKERNVRIHADLPDSVVKILGRPIPLFMQLLTLDLYRRWKKTDAEKAPLSKQDVEDTFNQLVRSSAAQDKLQHYHSRLRRYYSEPNLSAAHVILGQLSLSQGGISRSSLFGEFQRHLSDSGQTLFPHELKQNFNQLLRDLANDFYVEEISENRYDFASGVLKHWWRKYYA